MIPTNVIIALAITFLLGVGVGIYTGLVLAEWLEAKQ